MNRTVHIAIVAVQSLAENLRDVHFVDVPSQFQHAGRYVLIELHSGALSSVSMRHVLRGTCRQCVEHRVRVLACTISVVSTRDRSFAFALSICSLSRSRWSNHDVLGPSILSTYCALAAVVLRFVTIGTRCRDLRPAGTRHLSRRSSKPSTRHVRACVAARAAVFARSMANLSLKCTGFDNRVFVSVDSLRTTGNSREVRCCCPDSKAARRCCAPSTTKITAEPAEPKVLVMG